VCEYICTYIYMYIYTYILICKYQVHGVHLVGQSSAGAYVPYSFIYIYIYIYINAYILLLFYFGHMYRPGVWSISGGTE